MAVALSSSCCVDSSNDMHAVWGTLSPAVKEHVPRSAWNALPMGTKKYIAPRHVLAENLSALLKAKGWSGPELATRARVDRKTVNNMLNARYDPRPENVDAVAKVFGLNGWQLLRPSTGKNFSDAAVIERLIEKFSEATPEQRQTILHVVEMTGSHRALPEPAEPDEPPRRASL